MNYDVDYFIKKFEAIPEELWTTGTFKDDFGRKCAYGHCRFGEEFDSLSNISASTSVSVLYVNDGHDINYQQPTPKQRMLAALYDIKKMQEPKPEIIYKVVEVDRKVKELVKQERILN